jgi:hypothetical protein
MTSVIQDDYLTNNALLMLKNEFMFKGKIKKTIIFSMLALIGVGFLVAPSSQGQNLSPYYSGEAVEYNGTIYIGTANTGNFELFTLKNGELERETTLVSPAGEDMKFKDMTFSQENGQLYVYLVNGRYFYKYDLEYPEAPELVRESKDNSWYWYNGVRKKGDKVITMGNKGVLVYKEDGTVINSYNVKNKFINNISFSKGRKFLFNVKEQKLEILRTSDRQIISEIGIVNTAEEGRARSIYHDEEENLIYIVDDASVRAVDFNGEKKKEFEHVSDSGHDIIPSSDPRFVYFSDGVGVVKANKSDLSPAKWKFTMDEAGGRGWAMGLDRVGRGNNEKLAVFNNSSILILDNNMEVIDYIQAEENNYDPIEPMYLNLDKNRAVPDSKILLRGGGFGLYEDLTISFAGEEFKTEADENGRFSKIIEVPEASRGKTDIKVEEDATDRNYSIGFEIE